MDVLKTDDPVNCHLSQVDDHVVAGLRGAIAFALSLHLEFDKEQRHVIVTTTLIIVLFTIVVLGGSTMPLMKVLLLHSTNGQCQNSVTICKNVVYLLNNVVNAFNFKEVHLHIWLNMQYVHILCEVDYIHWYW